MSVSFIIESRMKSIVFVIHLKYMCVSKLVKGIFYGKNNLNEVAVDLILKTKPIYLTYKQCLHT